eukprot:scaffold22058_cov124-Isochrysis_galbana.AAC.2
MAYAYGAEAGAGVPVAGGTGTGGAANPVWLCGRQHSNRGIASAPPAPAPALRAGGEAGWRAIPH